MLPHNPGEKDIFTLKIVMFSKFKKSCRKFLNLEI